MDAKARRRERGGGGGRGAGGGSGSRGAGGRGGRPGAGRGAVLACEEAATASLSPDGWHGQNVSSNNLILEHFKPSIFVPSETKHIRGDYQSVFLRQ